MTPRTQTWLNLLEGFQEEEEIRKIRQSPRTPHEALRVIGHYTAAAKAAERRLGSLQEEDPVVVTWRSRLPSLIVGGLGYLAFGVVLVLAGAVAMSLVRGRPLSGALLLGCLGAAGLSLALSQTESHLEPDWLRVRRQRSNYQGALDKSLGYVEQAQARLRELHATNE